MGTKRTYFSFAYPKDLNQAYSFYCARYRDITYQEFLKLGLSDFLKKFESIPESEPLYKILKARSIDTSKIKDKHEKKYWNELKRINRIPDEYLSIGEIMTGLQSFAKENKL